MMVLGCISSEGAPNLSPVNLLPNHIESFLFRGRGDLAWSVGNFTLVVSGFSFTVYELRLVNSIEEDSASKKAFH